MKHSSTSQDERSSSSNAAEEKASSSQASEISAPARQAEPEIANEALRFKDLAMRAQADLENYRKRAVREKDEAIRYANASLLQKLLPILDSFELGLDAARTATDPTAIAQGMAMVQKQLQDFLRDQGVEIIPADGEVFDPTQHEAVSHEHSTEIPEGHIVRQLRKGYKLKNRLLRASSVAVSKGTAE